MLRWIRAIREPKRSRVVGFPHRLLHLLEAFEAVCAVEQPIEKLVAVAVHGEVPSVTRPAPRPERLTVQREKLPLLLHSAQCRHGLPFIPAECASEAVPLC